MLRLLQVEEISKLLLMLPDLVRQQEQRSTDFVANVDSWLSSLERELVANRLHQAGSVAMLRSALVSAEQGQTLPGVDLGGHATRRRVTNAVAAQALQQAAAVASNVIAENRERLLEAEQIAQQIVAIAVSRGLIPPRSEVAINLEYLRAVRGSLASSADLENAVVRLEGLVGPQDSLVLLDRALSLYLKSGLAPKSL